MTEKQRLANCADELKDCKELMMHWWLLSGELEQALKPFAEYAEALAGYPSTLIVLECLSTRTDARSITVADFRRAAETIAKAQTEPAS